MCVCVMNSNKKELNSLKIVRKRMDDINEIRKQYNKEIRNFIKLIFEILRIKNLNWQNKFLQISFNSPILSQT